MLELIFLAIWAFSLLIMLAEIYYEHDWPRETWKYFAALSVAAGLGYLWPSI